MANIFDIAKFYPRRGITIDRLERIKREGSPLYVWTPGAIAAGASLSINVEEQFTDSRKYTPLDWLEIVNNEGSIPITVTINATEARYCPASTIRTVKGSGVALRTITITNNHASATTTAGLIRLSLQKEPMTIDKWAQQRG